MPKFLGGCTSNEEVARKYALYRIQPHARLSFVDFAGTKPTILDPWEGSLTIVGFARHWPVPGFIDVGLVTAPQLTAHNHKMTIGNATRFFKPEFTIPIGLFSERNALSGAVFIENYFTFVDSTPAPDTKRFPHICPSCKSPAYIGFNVRVECSNVSCKVWVRTKEGA